MTNKAKEWSDKRWLSSDPYEGGSVRWIVADVKHSWDNELVITDCNRQVTLDFGWSNKEGLKKRIIKVQKLKYSLKLLEDALKECYDNYQGDEND